MATWCRIKNGKVAERTGRDPAVETPNSPYTWITCPDDTLDGWVYDKDKGTFTDPVGDEVKYAIVDADHRVLEDEAKADAHSEKYGMRKTIRPANDTDPMSSVLKENEFPSE